MGKSATDGTQATASDNGEDRDLDAVLADPRLTLAGLFFESWIGFSAEVERRLVAASGLSSPWFGLMLRIARSPDRRLRLTDLAEQTGMSPSGLTRALDRMEDAGHAQRVGCPADRRVAYATLTPEGLATLHAAAIAHLGHLDDILLRALSPQDQDDLTRLLRKVRDHVNPGAAKPPAALPTDS